MESTCEKISGFLFSFMLILTVISITLVYVSNYDTITLFVQEELSKQNLVPKTFDESLFPDLKQDLLDQCTQSASGLVEVQATSGRNLNIRCSDVQNIDTSNDLFALVNFDMFKEDYNMEHDCTFIKCFLTAENNDERVNLIVSYDAHNFYQKSYWFVIGATAVIGLVFAYCSKGFFNLTRNFGWAYFSMGVGFVITELFKLLSIPQISVTQQMHTTLPIVSKMISMLQKYFAVYFLVGVILLAIGYGGSMLVDKIKNKNKK